MGTIAAVLPLVPQWGPSQSQQVPQPWASQQHPYFHPAVKKTQQHAAVQFVPHRSSLPCPQPPTATAHAPIPQATSAPPAASSPPVATGPPAVPTAADSPNLQSTPRPDSSSSSTTTTEDDQLGISNSDEPAQAARPPTQQSKKYDGVEADTIVLWRKHAYAIMEDLGRCLARWS